MKFMFPSDPFNSRQIDEFFLPQAESLATEGYALFSQETQRVTRVDEMDIVVYRGWMLSLFEYRAMKAAVEEKGGELLTGVVRYANTHHIPLWYPVVKDFTPETYIIPRQRLEQDDFDLVEELKRLGWQKFIIKDFVKSLKTAGGSIAESPEDAPKIVELMKHYRGGVEGGLCIRKFEELQDEQRCFVFKGKHWTSFGEQILRVTKEADAMLTEVANRIDSPFFSIDFAYNKYGEPRVVELGDGQVSDLVGNWTPELFKQIFVPVLA